MTFKATNIITSNAYEDMKQIVVKIKNDSNSLNEVIEAILHGDFEDSRAWKEVIKLQLRVEQLEGK